MKTPEKHKRSRTSFNIERGLLDELRDRAHELRMDQSDAVEWGIRAWLEKYSKTTPPKGRPLFVNSKNYDFVRKFHDLIDNPETPQEMTLVGHIMAMLASRD